MQEITKKLHKKTLDDFGPIAEEMAKNGCNPSHIVDLFKKQMQLKARQYYGQQKLKITSTKEMFSDIDGFIKSQTADSKAEQIFYAMLVNSGLKFQYQYKIGPYRADYLFSGFLVVELDGPQHEKEHDAKRDEYMRRLGYKIIRVPLFVLMSCPEAVIDEIKEIIKKVIPIRRNK